MEETKACLLSYVLDGQGGGQVADLATITPDDPRFIWIHLNGRHPDTKKFLKEQVGLDPLIIRSLVADETRPRFEDMGDKALIMVRGINFNPGPTPEDLVSIRIWVSGNRVITVGRRKSQAIADIDDRLRHGRGPKRLGEFITMLCAFLNEGIQPALDELEINIDRLEDISLESPDAKLRHDIAAVRKQATVFRRHMAPQREVFNRLRATPLEWLTPADKWSMQDNNDRMTNFLEDLEALRDRSQILQDELYSALSAKLNKNLYVLSVITVIFMPLTFISGLLGMNVEGIPGAKDPLAFIIVCFLMVMIAFGQVMIFRRLKWV
ncbi:MAG: zinc transporter ZntB [Micavibrio sp.]|nr:zinc transporter ZntB [Micavibrio sp.]